jgi:hypothetical protein
MEENKFFKYLWRVNGVVLLIVGFLAIGVLTFAGYKIYSETMRERGQVSIVNIQPKAEIKEKWELGYMSKVPGTSIIILSLNSDQSYSQSYYNKSTLSARNYLFIDAENNTKHWLFKTNQQLVISIEKMTKHIEQKNRMTTILYKIVKEDTNNDKRLTNKDLYTIGLSQPDGTGYKEVLRDIEMLFGHQFHGEDKLLLIYQKKGINYSVNVNLFDFSLSNKEKLPKVGL